MVTRDEAFPSRFLKAGSLGGHEVTFVICSAEMQDLKTEDGTYERKLVAHLQGKATGKETDWVVNATNWDSIAELYADDTAGWIGKEVTLYSARVRFGPKTVDGIRVRVQPHRTGTGDNPPPRAQLEVQDRGSYKTSSMKPAEPPADDMDEPIPF